MFSNNRSDNSDLENFLFIQIALPWSAHLSAFRQACIFQLAKYFLRQMWEFHEKIFQNHGLWLVLILNEFKRRFTSWTHIQFRSLTWRFLHFEMTNRHFYSLKCELFVVLKVSRTTFSRNFLLNGRGSAFSIDSEKNSQILIKTAKYAVQVRKLMTKSSGYLIFFILEKKENQLCIDIELLLGTKLKKKITFIKENWMLLSE